jgi:hypothetical protein
MKETPRQHFRWAPHVAGAANVKRRDYDEGGEEIVAADEYAAWDELRESERPLAVGDLLETDSGALRICKYIGFEEAAWILPTAESPPQDLSSASGSTIGYTAADQPAGE